MIDIKTGLKNMEEELNLVNQAPLKTFKKNENIIEIGAKCSYLFFVEKGLIRNFFLNAKGKDITHWFASEGQLITIPPSFFKGQKHSFGLSALEESQLRLIDRKSYDLAVNSSEKIRVMAHDLITEIMIRLGQKILDFQSKNAEQRYKELLETHPDILNRAKLGHIASYLGITQQSLSRLRAML